MELSGNQLRYLNWLLDPRLTTKEEPEGKGSQNKFADRIGVHATTLSRWKSEPGFRAAWERKHQEVTGGIAMYQAMMENLRRIAMGEVYDAKPSDQRLAIMNYLELSGRFTPKKTLEIKDPALLQFSDEELATMARKRFRVIEGRDAKPAPRKAKRPRSTA